MMLPRVARVLVALLPLLPVVALALVPTAGADHVYSHRFVYEGRVLTADGLPAANRTVEFWSSDPFLRDPCVGNPHQDVTDEWGDFRFCFHVHELDPDARVAISVGNATIERLTDTAFRRGVVTLVLPDEGGESARADVSPTDNATAGAAEGAAPEGWERTYRIGGKVWQRGDVVLEGVKVFGVAIPDAPVNLTLLLPNGSTQRQDLVTDAYGDFDTTLVLEEGVAVEDVRVRLESEGLVQTRRLDPFSHRTTVGFFLPREGGGDLFQVNFQDEKSEDGAPGSGAPPVHPALLLALGLAVAGMVAVARKRRGAK